MFEIKSERDYLSAKKKLKSLSYTIISSWIMGISMLAISTIIVLLSKSLNAFDMSYIIIFILSIIILIWARLDSIKKDEIKVEIELWEKQQDKTNRDFCQI